MSEYRQTEYVVDFGDCRSNQFVRLNMALIEQNGAKLHEEIVRCRDCLLRDDFKYCNRLGFEVGDYGYCAWPIRKD